MLSARVRLVRSFQSTWLLPRGGHVHAWISEFPIGQYGGSEKPLATCPFLASGMSLSLNIIGCGRVVRRSNPSKANRQALRYSFDRVAVVLGFLESSRSSLTSWTIIHQVNIDTQSEYFTFSLFCHCYYGNKSPNVASILYYSRPSVSQLPGSPSRDFGFLHQPQGCDKVPVDGNQHA